MILPSPRSGVARFVAIAEAVIDSIESGRIEAGARLPGSRTLARTLGVNRNTVNAAFAELEAQGWVDTHSARGRFVNGGMSRHPAPVAKAQVHARASFGLPPGGAPLLDDGERTTPLGASVVLSGGTPDLRSVPRAALARAYRRALSQKRREVLDYADPRGAEPLRTALAEMLRLTRGIPCRADDILVTRGSQQALALAARVLVRPGDAVAVEALGYAPAWRIFRREGAELLPIPVDADGLDVEALGRLCRRRKVRAVYVTPHHQYPTLATLSGPRRRRLHDLAARHGFAILEDDYDHEFHYATRPVLPLAAHDASGAVVYIGTLSKILAPGLRVGYVVAPRNVLRAMESERLLLDRQGDTVVELALAELFEDGEVLRHARRMRRLYASRREAIVRLLRDDYAHALRFIAPDGGMSLWLELLGRRNAEAVAARALRHGVWIAPGRRFSLTGEPVPFLRLGYAAWPEATLARALATLGL